MSNQMSVIRALVGDNAAWLDAKITEFWTTEDPDSERFEYVDNIRVGLVGNAESERMYEEAHSQGCCGAFDTEFAHPSGQVFKFGFNHGH